MELLYERNGLPADVVANLRTMGYTAKETLDPNGRCHALMIDYSCDSSSLGRQIHERKGWLLDTKALIIHIFIHTIINRELASLLASIGVS